MLPLILLVLAQSTLSQGSSREYVFVNQQKNWWEARAYCRENFADLASMESQEDWEEVQGLGAEFGSFQAWMGLYDDVRSWRWSIDNTSLYENGVPRLWGLVHAANNVASREHCGLLAEGTTVHDHSCANAYYSVCYDEPSDTYIPVAFSMRWESARSYCRAKYTDLASMRSQKEKDGILSVVYGSYWWIGLFRDSWKWSDQSNSTFRAWAPGQPTGGDQWCGCIKPNGWDDCNCENNYPFICSVTATLRKVFKFKLKMDASVDMGDKAVQDGLLINIEKRLKDGGVQQSFRLTWRKPPNGQIFTQNVTQT